MTESDTRQCVHPSCHCAVEGEARYCSAYCENAHHGEEQLLDSDDAACACGHATCAEAHGVPASEEEVVVAMGGGPGEHRTPSGD